MTPRVIASRSSATFLPEKSIRDCAACDALCAAPAVAAPAVRPAFCAFCWRARALPPALAARLRFVLALLDPELRLLVLRELELRLLDDDFRVLLADVDLRALDPDPLLPELELRLREPDPEPEPDDFREDDDFRPELRDDDDPPRLPLPDSAIALLL